MKIFDSIFCSLFYFVQVSSTFGLSQSSFSNGDDLSLSHLISSPERYAAALNLTVDEVKMKHDLHIQASNDLHRSLQSKELSGEEKHSMLCQHRLKYGRHPFVCNQCWSYLPVCICKHAGEQKLLLPKNLEVVVWTHHREWGLTSNTGTILELMLENCTKLMKGLPEHDTILKNILEDKDCLSIVLWADQSVGQGKGEATSITLSEAKQATEKRRVVLIAVDGTWRNARRMVSKLPVSVSRLDLPTNVVFPDSVDGGQSILAPLRSKGPSSRSDSERQVCTAEAVCRAVGALGLSDADVQTILDITEKKVDLVRRYRGKP